MFFCQLEALETLIYITEVANKYGDNWVENQLRRHAQDANPDLYRMACKMATGSGKTVVMAMIIAWQALNKLANTQDARFSDAFLIVTPGITIRDRLRVLLPSDPENYYRKMDIVPADLQEDLGCAKVLITNFHAFKLRERTDAGKPTKAVLTQDHPDLLRESPDQMARRVCRALGAKKNIIVINDEAHHCYRRRQEGGIEEKLTGDDRTEAQQRDEEARVWISGIEAVKRKLGVKVVFDLSATPFFLRGSGYPEGTLFPWVVSDFSLIDAIESGIVKVPRVPVVDDSMTSELPTYRDLWRHIREALPRKGRTKTDEDSEPRLPAQLEGAMVTLYQNYERAYKRWEHNAEARANGLTPPVFIVVCNNTNVSKLVFNFIAGWEKLLGDGQTVPVPGRLALFSNVQGGQWTARPNTILVDGAQLESGEGMSPDFKKAASREIQEFKAEYRLRYPDRDPDELTEDDLLREVMNTVGKSGKLGEQVKCVVSVSMLTEGWDANTVTHILGVRAFGTQLLCEQVVGRGLRRMSYAVNDEGMFDPEYAEVYGVPFSFIPCAGAQKDPKPGRASVRVRALEERSACEITFPRLLGYVYDLPQERLRAEFSADSVLTLSSQDIPLQTEVAPIFGEHAMHYLDLRGERMQQVAFRLTRRIIEKNFPDGNARVWLFPRVLEITRRWLAQCVVVKDHAFPQMLLIEAFAEQATDRIYRAISAAVASQEQLRPLLQPYDTLGSTRYVDFDTTKQVFITDPNKCQVSHVVADSGWEPRAAVAFESMPNVLAYVKNQNLGFTIPYSMSGVEHKYIPDFIALVDDGRGREDPLHVIVEVTGARREDKQVKVDTARRLWVPAVNNHGGFGRWTYIENLDPWNVETQLREALALPIPVR